MYRYKLTQTRPRSATARNLQHQLLTYHDFRQARQDHPLSGLIEALGQWQAARLRATHRDLYSMPRYQEGLDFLLDDLYAPRNFTRRDDDFDRIFPTLVRLLPEKPLATLAQLVELNLISQQLDMNLATALHRHLGVTQGDMAQLSYDDYARGYRFCGDHEKRLRQIALVAGIGQELERYVANRALRMALRACERPATMAGLEELHRFIREGCRVFRDMDGVHELLARVVSRENWLLEQMLAGKQLPERLPPELAEPAH
ncbi:MAG: hypothetical protein EA349_10260 [Halomonadaceae bacterium]|nr:MAG: hypothetical protein EA349_10260 [Halomonadaceae bacterium]